MSMDCEYLFIGDDEGSRRVEYNEQDLQHYQRENEAVGNLKDWDRDKQYECIVLHSKMDWRSLRLISGSTPSLLPVTLGL